MSEELRAENQRLRRALLQIAEDAESPQNFYDRNGPQWTTPSGAEYENTSDFLAKCNELASTARDALSGKSNLNWRVFESILDRTHFGIEIDGDEDADPILFPVKISREKLQGIVDAHNPTPTSQP